MRELEERHAQPIVYQGIPDSVAALIWRVFFASRGRGLSFHAHFPWARDAGVRSIIIPGAGDDVSAALVIRAVSYERTLVGLVGTVCVAEEHRGRGLSRTLLRKAEAEARGMDLAALVLWTTKPGVYAREGFVPDPIDAEFMVLNRGGGEGVEVSRSPWPGPKDRRGLPSFAHGAESVRMEGAEIIILHTEEGKSLAEWSGDEYEVAALLRATMPASWRLHCRRDDPILSSLAATGSHLVAQPAAFRLVKAVQAQRYVVPFIPLLDRV